MLGAARSGTVGCLLSLLYLLFPSFYSLKVLFILLYHFSASGSNTPHIPSDLASPLQCKASEEGVFFFPPDLSGFLFQPWEETSTDSCSYQLSA